MLGFLSVLFTSAVSVKKKKQLLEECYDMEMSYTMEDEVNQMCNVSDGFEEKVCTQKDLAALRNIMSGLDTSFERAADLLKIPEADRARYKELLSRD